MATLASRLKNVAIHLRIAIIIDLVCNLQDGDEVGVSFNKSSLSFETATVLSVSRQQSTLVKCSKMASYFEKLILVRDIDCH